MPSAWTNKPCARCGRKKSAKYLHTKYCYRCTLTVKRERSTAKHRKEIAKLYRIAPDEYDKLYDLQNGRCAICLRASKTKRLAVDHDHATELVRGLLCGPCNKMLGHVRDSVEVFERAIAYLRQPPLKTLREREGKPYGGTAGLAR